MGVTIFSIHGNHEERPYNLPYYHEKEWRGGTVYVEDDYPNILFGKDGEVYDLDGHQAIVIGGAYSVDKPFRLANGYNWFSSEQPDATTKTIVEASLDMMDWNIDLVLSHTCRRSSCRLKRSCHAWINRPLTAARRSGWTQLRIA